MNWKAHATKDQLMVLEDPSKHGTQAFRTYAERVLDISISAMVKSRLHEKDHPQWERSWAHAKNDDLVRELKGKIVDIMESLDNKAGGHGHKGAAWMDQKSLELKNYFLQLTTK